MSASILGRIFFSQSVSNGVQGATGAFFLSETFDVLTKNPIIPISILGIVLFVVLKKK
jgi:hypothetical protein